MGKNKIIIFLLAVVFLADGCYLLWRRYRDDKYKFSIEVPRFWERADDPNNVVVMLVRDSNSAGGKFQANINVNVAKDSEGAPLDLIFDVNKEAVLKALPGAKYDVVEDEIRAGMDSGRSVTFTYSVVDLPKLKIISAIWTKNKRIYVVTASCELDKYRQYAATFKKVLSSLRMDN